jgi:hypothetical protein
VTIEHNDYIYCNYQVRWDAAPIVIESHKLVFFTVPKVGCTAWKQLFQRMMGYKEWKRVSPHDPETNGRTYLWDYKITRAAEIINNPSYTKAIFVRDPKERFLSAYLEKAAQGDGRALADICCPDRSCLKQAKTFSEFVRFSQTQCKDNAHWLPQSQRMEMKFWDKTDFVGHWMLSGSCNASMPERNLEIRAGDPGNLSLRALAHSITPRAHLRKNCGNVWNVIIRPSLSLWWNESTKATVALNSSI